MRFEPTAARLWKRLGREERNAAASSFWKETPPEVTGMALAALVKARHMRPQVARSLPPEEQARALASVLDVGEPVASSLLVALHLGERRAMLATFLDAAADRRNFHYKRQLERYRTGDPNGPPPDGDDD